MKEPVQLCYTISEAAKVMEVEPHVLRYWEEELGLDISRNSMGHRIYTDDDLKTFRAIKQLKANHVALKEIRQQIVVSGEKTGRYVPGGRKTWKSDRLRRKNTGDKLW